MHIVCVASSLGIMGGAGRQQTAFYKGYCKLETIGNIIMLGMCFLTQLARKAQDKITNSIANIAIIAYVLLKHQF